jgi:hypothetical protein
MLMDSLSNLLTADAGLLTGFAVGKITYEERLFDPRNGGLEPDPFKKGRQLKHQKETRICFSAPSILTERIDTDLIKEYRFGRASNLRA